MTTRNLQKKSKSRRLHEPVIAFDDWLNGRRPQHLSTNAGTDFIAFQTWRNFKEAFTPELIEKAYEETSGALGRAVRNCIDPFSGSGTTAIACQFLGVSPLAIEVNPYLADLTEAKIANYNVEFLIRDFRKIAAAKRRRMPRELFPSAPATLVEPGVNNRFVFYRLIAERLAHLRDQIGLLKNPVHRRLMRVLLGSTALEVSNVVVSGKGRRYRRSWESRTVDPKLVNQLFETYFTRAVYDIRRFQNRACKNYDLIRGDSRSAIPVRRRFDLAVFSPPYPNSFDYTDVYNIELWICGYFKAQEDNRRLRMSTLRSHVQLLRDFSAEDVHSVTLEQLLPELNAVRQSLWNRHIPDMIKAYFGDMTVILGRLRRCIRRSGRIYIVAGDSRYNGINIPVTKINSEIASQLSLKLIDVMPFRSMRSSPQQGGKEDLNESLLVLGQP